MKLSFPNALVRDVLAFIANATGINITYDRDVTDGRPISIQLDGVTLEQALNQIMTMAQLSYKVVNDRSIFVFPDTTQKHTLYDEQVVRTFYISNADPTELSQTLSQLIRIPGIAVQPMIAVNKTSNTITVRATSPVMQILDQVITAERQAARRDDLRRRDPRSRSHADEELRVEPDRLRAGRHLFAGGGANRDPDDNRDGDGGRNGNRDGHGNDDADDDCWNIHGAKRRHLSAAVQPEHDLARASA